MRISPSSVYATTIATTMIATAVVNAEAAAMALIGTANRV
jgi:hypothetical protein